MSCMLDVENFKVNITTHVPSDGLTNQAVQVYPNPSTGVFDARFDLGGSERLNLEVHNMISEKVFAHQAEASGTYIQRIDLSHMPRGVYILHVKAGNINETRKLIKH